MSAVMSTLSIISGGGRARRKLASSRKSGHLSDAGEDRTRTQHDLHRQQRSASLQTLESGGGGGGGVVNLDSLEAKMASIEVSLGGRRRSCGGNGVITTATAASGRELDALRAALTDKDALIQNLKKQLSASLSAARLSAQSANIGDPAPAPLSAEERRALDERAAAVKQELDNRRQNILELRRRLEKTHVTDNIDTRIQQAELQYQLGREELETLTLGEQARALVQLIDAADAAASTPTTYSMVRECGGTATLVTAEVREGTWGCVVRAAGALVEWPGDNPALRQGDRLLEVNGVSMVACRSQEELQRAVAAASPARLVLIRGQPKALTQNEAVSLRSELGALRTAAEEAERAKEDLRSDNTRLTHRISYLEEQVSELLARHSQLHSVSSTDSTSGCITVNNTKKNVTNISIRSEPKPNSKSEVQVFQKGPDITAIVAKLPGLDGEGNLPVMRPRSNASGASSRAAVSPRASPAPALAPPPHRSHSAHSIEHRANRMRTSLSHHCIHPDYSAETDAAIRMIERNQRHMEKQRLKNRSRDEFVESERHKNNLNRSRDEFVESERHKNNHNRSRDEFIESERHKNNFNRSRDEFVESERQKNNHNRSRDEFHESERHKNNLNRSRDELDSEDFNNSQSSVCDPRHYEIKKVADRIEQSIKKTNWAERKTLSIIEQLKRSQRLRKQKKNESAEDIQIQAESEKYMNNSHHRIDGKVLENAHKSSRRTSKLHSRSAKSSEMESESDFPDMYCSSPRIDYCSDTSRMSHYKRDDERRDGDGKSRPTPPRKPLRLSLHKARSAHSLVNGSESETPRPETAESPTKRPVKRTHATDRWSRERVRDGRESGRSTPRPSRKSLHGLSACDAPAPAPAADDLYPENNHTPTRSKSMLQAAGKWC